MYDYKKIRLARLKAGYSEKELGELAKMGPATIKRIESGKSMRPASVRKIAAALGMKPEDFISDEILKGA